MSWYTNIFAPDGSDVYVRREWTGAGSQYALIQRLTTDLYLSMYLDGTLSIGGEFMRLGKMYASRLYKAHNKDSASLTLVGGWVSSANNGVLGGYLTFRQTAGAYVEFTTADNVTEVGCISINNQTNNGVALVTIDGDNTLADLLSTAQQLVDAGTLESTVLVANGGTLNPTDRVWNLYNLPSTSITQLFSNTLAAGVHTIRVTVTGYKQTASSGAYVTFQAFLEWGAGLFTPALNLYYLKPVYNIFTTGTNPVWEISYSIIPTGGSSAEWVGHSGSLKFTELPVITVDGSVVTPAVGATVAGQDIEFDMQFAVRHTQTGSTDLGMLDMTYTLNVLTGFWIAHTLTWLVGGSQVSGYPCMMSIDSAIFDRGKSPDTDTTIFGLADGLFKCHSDDSEIWFWDYNGYLGAYMQIPDLETTVNNWLESGGANSQLFVQDHANYWAKTYANRFSGRAYTAGEVWQSQANYRFKWFTDGADATLEHFWETYSENMLSARARNLTLTGRARALTLSAKGR